MLPQTVLEDITWQEIVGDKLALGMKYGINLLTPQVILSPSSKFSHLISACCPGNI